LTGILLGTVAALSFGLSDTLAGFTARLLGTLRATAGLLLISLISLVTFALAVHVSVNMAPSWLLQAGFLGIVQGVTYLLFLQALRYGPIAIVGAITAVQGAVTVVLAVLVLGEHPSIAEWVAVVVSTLGVVLAASTVLPNSSWRAATGLGPIFAILSVIAYGFYVVGLPLVIRTGGWVGAILISRSVSTVLAWVVLLVVMSRVVRVRRADHLSSLAAADMAPIDLPLPRRPSWGQTWFQHPVTRGAIAILVISGLLSTMGQISRGAGLAVAPAWLIGLITSMSPAVLIVAGLVTGERLTSIQWIGIAVLIIGMVGLGVVR
jgi:drug/metabolite transporter (DMT)-like permease